MSVCALSHSAVSFGVPWTVALQAFVSMGILQARILEWVTMPSSREPSQPTDGTQVSCIAGGFFTSWATRKARWKVQTFKLWCIIWNLQNKNQMTRRNKKATDTLSMKYTQREFKTFFFYDLAAFYWVFKVHTNISLWPKIYTCICFPFISSLFMLKCSIGYIFLQNH